MDPVRFAEKVRELMEYHNFILTNLYKAQPVDVDAMIEETLDAVNYFKSAICDTVDLVHRSRRAGKIMLFEGAQGSLLDIDHGTYPFVTSSNTTAGGVATGSGLGPRYIDAILGITKAYATRVGSGPMPTELFDSVGEHLAVKGQEVGTTTGRGRRCGWFDAPIARYATRINGLTDIFLTKLDVLSGIKEIPVCVAYEVDGQRVEEIPVSQTDFHHAKPIYEMYPGWDEDITGVTSFEELPKNAQNYVLALEKMSGTRISAIGVGPDRNATLVRHEML